jgi:hypothetical protein
MSDSSLESTEPSGHHGLRTGLKVEDIRQSLLDNLFYAMNRRILLPALSRKSLRIMRDPGSLDFFTFPRLLG